MTDSQRWMVICGVLLTAALIYVLQPILTPFLVGALLAYLGDPVADWLETKKLNRTLAVTIVFGFFAALSIGMLVIIIPLLGKQIIAFVESIPAMIDWVQLNVLPWIKRFLRHNTELIQVDQLKAAFAEHWQEAGGILTQLVKQMTASGLVMVTVIVNLMIIPVVTFYLLRDWDEMMARIFELLPMRIAPTAARLAKESDEVLGAFLRGQLSVMASLAVVYSIGLSIVGLDFALLVGVIAGLFSVVPYLGPIVGIAAAGTATLIQFPDLWHILGVCLVFGIGQMLEGMWLTPLLVGDRIGLHPVAVIFAILSGGQLGGFAGVLLALPTAAVLMVFVRLAHEKYKSSNLYNKPEEKEESDIFLEGDS